MNDLGITLAWIAAQVTFLGVPALALHGIASRRGPAQGAWVATLTLALVVALSLSGLIGVDRHFAAISTGHASVAVAPKSTSVDPRDDAIATNGPDAVAPTAAEAGWDLSGLRRAWARIDRGVAEPAARFRPWGGVVAIFALAATGFGLLRLVGGLWAIRICRLRGRPVDDPGLSRLLDELRRTMDCRPAVELREVAELTTPATAGWRRPVILLPDDWRTWDAPERRAVLAHELAHILRDDYVAGLVARLAVVLNAYHPLVRWLAGRLQLQQEQAADALGARFAGGRVTYLLALSSLALKQDGRSPSWPARAFLPGRGTLIRRITMLRDQNETGTGQRPSSGAWRLTTALALLGLTIGPAMLRGPARAADDEAPAPVLASAEPGPPALPTTETPFNTPHARKGMAGLIAFRPAAALRLARKARPFPFPLISDWFNSELAILSGSLKVDTSAPGFLRLGFEDVEWVTCGVGFGRGVGFGPGGVQQEAPLHRLELRGMTIRTAAPFDWPRFLRQWHCNLEEVRESGRIYYKLTGPPQSAGNWDICIYLPDDRTTVVDDEAEIRALVNRGGPSKSASLLSADWERACRGLLAVVLDNQGGALGKSYDLGRPDDALVLSLLKGVDRWIFSVDEHDSMAFRAAASCVDGGASSAVTRAIDSLLTLAKAKVEKAEPASPPGTPDFRSVELARRMATSFLANLRIRAEGPSIGLQAEGFGTLADLALMFEPVLALMLETEGNAGKVRDRPVINRPKVPKP
ncbi:M56 family metallopeptidase [Isosphaeraceae bacterium EP7]